MAILGKESDVMLFIALFIGLVLLIYIGTSCDREANNISKEISKENEEKTKKYFRDQYGKDLIK